MLFDPTRRDSVTRLSIVSRPEEGAKALTTDRGPQQQHRSAHHHDDVDTEAERMTRRRFQLGVCHEQRHEYR
jgi:hypothetical protein